MVLFVRALNAGQTWISACGTSGRLPHLGGYRTCVTRDLCVRLVGFIGVPTGGRRRIARLDMGLADSGALDRGQNAAAAARPAKPIRASLRPRREIFERIGSTFALRPAFARRWHVASVLFMRPSWISCRSTFPPLAPNSVPCQRRALLNCALHSPEPLAAARGVHLLRAGHVLRSTPCTLLMRPRLLATSHSMAATATQTLLGYGAGPGCRQCAKRGREREERGVVLLTDR